MADERLVLAIYGIACGNERLQVVVDEGEKVRRSTGARRSGLRELVGGDRSCVRRDRLRLIVSARLKAGSAGYPIDTTSTAGSALLNEGFTLTMCEIERKEAVSVQHIDPGRLKSSGTGTTGESTRSTSI